MNYSIIALIALSLFFGCKTQEDIRRDRTMETINEKIIETQQGTASVNVRFQNLEDQVAKLNGSTEEITHNSGTQQKDIQNLKERITTLEAIAKKQSENISLLADKVNEQTKYIEQVIKSLADLNAKREAEIAQAQKAKTEKIEVVEKEQTVKQGIAKYKAKHYSEAKTILSDLVENAALKKKDKAAALLYLGLIEYHDKKYEDAKIYFSKLFTEMPDSSFAPSALLNLAKTFTNLKSKEEAKQTIDELVTRFPKSKEAAEGTTLKEKL